MKAVVVYYSLEGNTEYVSEKIAEHMDADLLRLEPVKEYPKGNFSKYFWGGKSVVFGEKPKLTPYDFRADQYDIVIIGTPVWAGSFTPPIKTFLSENDLSKKKVALFACNSGGSAEECFTKLKKEMKLDSVAAAIEFANPGMNRKAEDEQTIKEFCMRLSSPEYLLDKDNILE